MNEKPREEKLFRAMSGVDEELLLRSEQSTKRHAGKVHKVSMRYAARIAAACLCFAVVGVLYVTMSSTKMADNTGSAAMAVPQQAYSMTADQETPEEVVADTAQSEDAVADSVDTAEVPELALADSGQQAASGNSADGQKQSGLDSVKTENASQESELSVSGNEVSQEAAEKLPEDDGSFKKQGRQLPQKMTAKGQ